MLWPFELHRAYHRRNDIHARFGGQQQGGISTPANVPGIFIFTSQGGSNVGYQDDFLPDGTFHYTGQGQVGDMLMSRGNLAIRDHVQNGKDILLFHQTKKGGLVRFEGIFVCGGWEFKDQLDITGQKRKAIVFTLVPQKDFLVEMEDQAVEVGSGLSLTDLRERALQAAHPPQESSARMALVNVRTRSKAVREYVLARSGGRCESCGEGAPFFTALGQPYLEAHHILKLSDGGPDHPASVAALCPNCHRRAHLGADSTELNNFLLKKIRKLEI